MNPARGQIHNVSEEDAYALLDSRPEGLSEPEVLARRREVGPNRLQPPSRFRWTKSLGKHFVNFFSILLDVAAGVCFIADSIQSGEGMGLLGWALLGVSILNSVFAFVQERRAERAMEELRKFLPQRTRVRRAASEIEVEVEEIVPGDLLLLAEGDRVPADARLVESEDLLVNNAPLTGESRSQPLASGAARGAFIESPNLLFAGCSILRGSGAAVVFATGHRTEFGKIAALSRDIRRPLSPLQRETARMVRVLTVIAVSMGLAFFAYGIAAGRPLWVNIVFMLGIIVANVPEGLLPTFTLALSMASLRMARKKVLVKSLDAVEALGDVHVICTDKTGTLTRNELAIASIVEGVHGEEIREPTAVQSFLKAALVASELRETSGRYSGDPLDVAVLRRYEERFGSAAGILAATRRHFPFDLEKRREAGVFSDGAEVFFAVKGAWESLSQAVTRVELPGQEAPLAADGDALSVCHEIVRRLSTQGQRVIAVASRSLDSLPERSTGDELLERDLVLRGFLALDDPLRPEVPAAVSTCRRAGIRVLLITGDHPDTAGAVARQCGILTPDGPAEGEILLGSELERLRERQLIERLQGGATVFARTTPEQKMKIVTALRRLGHVVAMTGDGVNDSPALRAANVGLAMGIGGTDVAREAADIVLLDNNFASIASGIAEGRAVYANMQRFTTYVLASNVPEILPYLIYILLPVPLALTVIQILSIDLGTDILPAIGLGQEPPEAEVMERAPRRPDERLLSFRMMKVAYFFLGVIQSAFSLFLFFLVLHAGGWRWGDALAESDPLYRSATGVTLATVILMQIGNVIGRRSQRGTGLDAGLLRNRIILLGIGLEVAFSWAILYFEPLRKVLGTAAVSWPFYLLAWAGIPLIFLLDLLRKRL